jgi:nitrite reductase/ring-hydroxylating ferredoxin subunit
MIVQGPKARGDVNGYVLCDGKTAYFSAKTGEAIGREFRIKPAAMPQARTNTVVMASRTSQGVDRRYVR